MSLRLPHLRSRASLSFPLLTLLGLLAGCDDGGGTGGLPGSSGGPCSDKYPLLANAGADRSVDKNTWVTLDGTASVDPNGNGMLAYQWAIVSPSGEKVNPSGATSPAPGFVASQSGVYRGSLVVSSACDTSEADTVSITVVNTAPVAEAGPDQRARKRSVVQLSGSESSDADQDTLTYAWRILSAPAGSNAQLSGANTVNPTLVSEVPGVYQLSLVVHDGEAASAADIVEVTLYNSVPVAQANADQESAVRSTVTLSAAGSSDADGDALTHQWTFASRPAGSSVSLTGATTAAPTFVPDVDGRYELDLVVHDGTDASPADRVAVTVYRYIQPLAYKVVDAEYSKSLERIVSVSASPSVLHLYDPVAEAETTVTLSLAPNCVSVSPDGRFAAVGHNGYISYVNLETRAVVGAPLAVSANVGDVVLSATHAYAIPALGVSGFSYMHSVNLGTGKETVGSTIIDDGSRAKLHPGGTALYVVDGSSSPEDLSKFNLGSGPAVFAYDSRYHGDYYLHTNLWMSEDGKRLISGSGAAFTTVPTATVNNTTDLQYNGVLEDYAPPTPYYARLQWVDHDSTTNTVAAIPRTDWYSSNPNEDTQLKLYSGDFLARRETLALPRFVLSGKGHLGHGRFVFHSNDGSRRFVVLQADASAGLAQDYGITAY